jgi:carbon storage regulator
VLVISRKLGDKFQIGSDITIRIVRIRGNAVRIGIEAPDDMPIYRVEVLEAIKRIANEEEAVQV